MTEIAKYLNKNANSDLQASYNIFKILERLGWLQLYFTEHKNTYSNSMIKFLLSKLKPLTLNLTEPNIFAIYGDYSEDNKAHIVDKIICGNIGKFYD